MKKIPVILDTDIGSDIDDTWALAMLLKSPELDLRLLTASTQGIFSQPFDAEARGFSVNVVAIVRKYLKNNVNVDYDDGSFEWFDTTQLSIVEPSEVIDRIIPIDHNVPQPPESPWRKIGAQLRLELAKDISTTKSGQSIQIFSDGIQILAVE